MYGKPARGHATAWLNSLRDHDRIVGWPDGPKGRKALDVFDRSSCSKKPGRVLKRLRPLMRPVFDDPEIPVWTKRETLVVASGLSKVSENRIFHLPQDAEPLYAERAVFLSDAILATDDFEIEFGVSTRASMSHHALARLLERGGASPEDISFEVELALRLAAKLADVARQMGIGPEGMQSFMIPHPRGAFVAVSMDMDPGKTGSGEERQRILSIRTWLDADMLSEEDHERMGSRSSALLAGLYDLRDRHRLFELWVKGNARPWSFADTTLDNAGRISGTDCLERRL